MPYVDPKTCTNLPFRPLQPTPSGMFATVAENSPVGYRRIAPSLTGMWTLQPKYDLYRVIINTSGRGTIFNTVGLAMAESTSGIYKESLGRLRAAFPNEWIDAFIRVLRSGDTPDFGQGAILVNDIVLPSMPFWERQGKLVSRIPELGICRQLPHRSLVKVPCFPEHVGLPLWAALKELQAKWTTRGVSLYTGMVGKCTYGTYTTSADGYTTGSWLSYPFSPVLSLTTTQPDLALTPT